MMNEDCKGVMFQISQTLADNGEYEQALKVLESADCAMGLWMKGKIYYAIAENVSKSFEFKYYASSTILSKYNKLLKESYSHLYNAVLEMHKESVEIIEHLNQCIWRQLTHVESQIARYRTTSSSIVEEAKEYEEYFEANEEMIVDSLVDQMTEWDL